MAKPASEDVIDVEPMETRALSVVRPQEDALSIGEVKRQVNLMQELLRDVMQDGQHYGMIPGCGNKKVLLKPGAEKIGLVFGLKPEYVIERLDLGGGHFGFQVICRLINSAGKFMGEGVGFASSMESKYRYRSGEKEIRWTGRGVPKNFWDHFKTNKAEAQKVLGGKQYWVKKNDEGKWEVVEMVGDDKKVENPNPADTFNTVLKIAKKRAQVDATITATAASDIFTQDIEETDNSQEGN